jgi:hypothetical protein
MSLKQVLAVVTVLTGVWTSSTGAHADGQAPAYHYVSLQALLPEGYLGIDAVKLDNRGRVYGTLIACPDDFTCVYSTFVYRNGRVIPQNNNMAATTANERGRVGGIVYVADTEQAAIFDDGQTEVIPRLPGEVASRVLQVLDDGTALIESTEESARKTYYFYDKRKRIEKVDLDDKLVQHVRVNNAREVAGTLVNAATRIDKAFRIARPGRMTLLEPVAGDTQSWAQAIDDRGNVLGYSWGANGVERIGVWKNKKFQTYFVQGTAEYPTRTNALLWNESGLIVGTRGVTDTGTYLYPRPGVRLPLAELSDTELPLVTIIDDVNERGDLLGWGGSAPGYIEDFFLLERTCSAL